MSIRLYVSGGMACFTRPEFKAERLSYEVPTPSAARGMLEAIYWQPSMRWIVEAIHILRPIRFGSVRRNEASLKASTAKALRVMQGGDPSELPHLTDRPRQQRSGAVLLDVAYVIEASIGLTETGRAEDVGKHVAIFRRRAARGQCFHRPYLGCREFPAEFTFIEPGASLPTSTWPVDLDKHDLGWMLYDIDYSAGAQPRFFRARLIEGRLDVAACLNDGMSDVGA